MTASLLSKPEPETEPKAKTVEPAALGVAVGPVLDETGAYAFNTQRAQGVLPLALRMRSLLLRCSNSIAGMTSTTTRWWYVVLRSILVAMC